MCRGEGRSIVIIAPKSLNSWHLGADQESLGPQKKRPEWKAANPRTSKSVWPSGKALDRKAEGPRFDSASGPFSSKAVD